MPSSKRKILFLGNSRLTVFGFRKEIVQTLVEDGCEVWTSFPNGPFGNGEDEALKYGCHFVETHIDRRGKNPLKDLSLIAEYYRLMKHVKPGIVFAFTVKPDVYAGLVCRILRVPYVLNITGLGKALAEGGLLSKLTGFLYKLASSRAQKVFFQNATDKGYFDTHNIKYKDCEILPGSGVNLNEFTPLSYPEGDATKFIYIARVMKAKGIEEYFQAAHEIKKEYPNTEFHICGYCEEDYKEEIKKRVEAGDIIYHGLVDDVKEYEKDCHCVVLPSFHPEGISNVLLEAAACGRPIITTDHPGCRETVDDGVTGFLVRKQDSDDLIKKMKSFINLPLDDKKKMGLAGRAKVAKEFDRNIVVNAYCQEVSRLDAHKK